MVSWPTCCTASWGIRRPGAAPQGQTQAGEHPRHQLLVLNHGGAHLEGAADALADGEDLGDGQLRAPVQGRHGHFDRRPHLHPVPVAVVDFSFDLEEVGIIEGQQGLPRLGQVAHRHFPGRHHRGLGRPDNGVALQGSGFLGLGLGRSLGPPGRS